MLEEVMQCHKAWEEVVRRVEIVVGYKMKEQMGVECWPLEAPLILSCLEKSWEGIVGM